jgi:Domain of unknown function (DUF4349)
MRQRFPGFGFALSASVAVLATGCGGAGAAGFKLAAPETAAASPAPPPPPEAGIPGSPPVADAAPMPSPSPTSATSEAPPADAPSDGNVARRAPQPGGATLAASREMLDIEANVTMLVPKVKHAVKSLHELTARLGGVVTEERVDSASQYGSAQLTLRVPSAATQSVFEQLEQLGNVLDQNVTARDIGKEYFDANLRLSSLEATLHRYEEILTHATKVEEILRIEAELGRVRGEIEQVKGNLRWLADRAARATLHVTLREQVPEIAHSDAPEPKFFPGLRLPALIDFGKKSTEGYVGGGFALRFSRAISLDLDVFKRPNSNQRGPDAVLASIGGEIYSDLLGGGERRYLNPYLGWRAGYARFDTDNQVLLGATLGLELYKNRWFGLDVEARNYLAAGGPRGAHYLLTPALAARVAF